MRPSDSIGTCFRAIVHRLCEAAAFPLHPNSEFLQCTILVPLPLDIGEVSYASHHDMAYLVDRSTQFSFEMDARNPSLAITGIGHKQKILLMGPWSCSSSWA